MPMTGPAPKDDPVRRNSPTFDKTYVEWDDVVRGPDLPEDIDWHPRTKEWWEKWRRSPQALVMLDSDWEMMLETALLHTRLWYGKMSSAQLVAVAGEVRRRVAALGSTFEDRLKLRIVIQTDADEQNEDKKIEDAAEQAVNYMERLLNATASVRSEAKEPE